MTDKLYTKSDMDRELSALRERCADIVDDLFAKYQRSPDAWAKGWRSACAEIEEQIRALPITPHTEEGTPDWDDLRGVAPDATGDLSSEAFIRKQRDEWGD